MGVIGKTEAANFIPEVWANVALGKLESELYLARNVARDTEFTTQQEGDIIHVPKRGSLSANQKTSGSAVTLQNPSDDKVDVNLDQHWEVTFAVEDIVKAQANQDVMEGYIEDAVTALAEKIETKLAALYSSASNTAGTAGTDITDTVLLNVRKTLTENRAPRTDRYLYLDPSQVNAILKMDKFVANPQRNGEPTADGLLGSIYGMRVYESIFVQTSGSSPTTTHNLALHRNAFVLAMRPLPEPKAPGAKVAIVERNGLLMRVIYSYNASYLADQVTIDTLFGVAAMRPELAVDLKS